MKCRIICPHCHCAIDPLSLESALSVHAEYRICPECDTPIVVSQPVAEAGHAPAIAGDEPLTRPARHLESGGRQAIEVPPRQGLSPS